MLTYVFLVGIIFNGLQKGAIQPPKCSTLVIYVYFKTLGIHKYLSSETESELPVVCLRQIR